MSRTGMPILLLCVWLHTAGDARQTIGTSTGSISGRVTDASGAPIPDVAIVVRSASMIGPRVTRTDRDGRYAVPMLPPGAYLLEFSRDRFATVRREGQYISLGFTAQIDVTMAVAPVEEEVTVSRDSRLIDARSTTLGASFDATALADLPGSRSMSSVVNATPGVFVNTFEVGVASTAPAFGAYGTFGFNRPLVEGISVTNVNTLGLTLDFGAFDDVVIATGGLGVEWNSPGVQPQFSARSGGNQYHGSVYADFAPSQWQSANIDAVQIARGAAGSPSVPAATANQVQTYHDANADLGGFIRRDRVWWYGSLRRQSVATRQVNFAVAPIETRLANYGGKITGRAGPHHRLIAFGQGSRNEQPTRLDPFGQGGITASNAIHTSRNSTADSSSFGGVWKLEWNAGLTDRLFVEVRGGQFGGYRRERPNGTGPRSEDVTTMEVTGGGRDWQTRIQRDQLFAVASYAPAWNGGGHFFKIGGEASRQLAEETWWAGYPGDVLHVLRNTRAAEVYLLQTPSWSVNGLWAYAAYVNDTWRLGRVTLNLGGRFDRYRAFLPPQWHSVGRFNPEPLVFAGVAEVMDWNSFAPRLALVFDVTGDARTLIKIGANQYWLPPGSDFGNNANRNALQWWRRHIWSDPNGSGVWERGEEGALLGARGGVDVESIDPALTLPSVREVTAFLEREVRTGLAARAGVVWRRETDPFQRVNANQPADAFAVPVTLADPGPDGLPGTPDDGAPVPVWELAPAALGLPAANIVRNIPGSPSDFWTLETGVTARRTRWSLTAGFSYIWQRDHAAGFLGQAVRQNEYAVNPNDYLHTDGGGRYSFGVWSAKAHGTYAAPYDIRITPFVRHQSGHPFGRTFVGALNYSRTVRLLAEPIGTRRMDHVTLVDLRVEKGFRFGQGSRVAGFVDVFNVLNANPAQQMSWSSGTFLRPLNIVSPRLARFGVKVGW